MLCHCKSKKEFSICCEPYLKGDKTPSNPLELMRSRYSAYCLADAKYIEMIKQAAQNVEWLSLEIILASENIVEFKAYYRDAQGLSVQHEKSFFVFQNNRWLYDKGVLYNSKIERNKECPCGSRKKYKKCCAKN